MVAVSNIVVVQHYIFFLLLSSNFSPTIDRMVGVPGHGKNIVNTINACDK